MNQNFSRNNNVTPPPTILPVIVRLKDSYILWQSYFIHIPKISKYTIGEKIDKLFVDAIEATVSAGFIDKKEKIPYLKIAIRKTDTLKVFLQIAWETKALDDQKYLTISEKLSEAGKMLGGWHGKLTKENSSAN
jgi:hypothetical protein